MKITFLLSCLFCVTSLFAQDYKLNQVTKQDFSSHKSAETSDAGAEILFKTGVLKIEYDEKKRFYIVIQLQSKVLNQLFRRS